MSKRYFVDFYDGFDGWIRKGMEPEDEVSFNDLELARKFRDEKNAELNKNNIAFGEHYGIIDTQINQEIECCKQKLMKTN